ncbi:hypothetical protein [Nocardia sp. MW-W600-9]
MVKIDVDGLLKETKRGGADYASIRDRIDNELGGSQDMVQQARDALTKRPGTAQEQEVADRVFVQDWPKLQSAMMLKEDVGAAIEIAARGIQDADAEVKPLLIAQTIDYLTASRRMSEDAVTKLLLVNVSPELKQAIEDHETDQKNAVIARHNVDQAQQGTGRYLSGRK